ncbi:hydantoinase B/oxoprolinase family protein [Enterovirga rhinocerotis]|uniref:N-methylhydantoinase B n=1 Tax=Enterovirga rhinocerotis TaxID=1339210 RepID=A0A4V3DXL3_9HYPH|nr:hydantoinase B/oxoprolinase family protein [Enterovirga rhinocerotis]TDR88919.1 N-methylhydantoinase B [Enterovirga rhinocerotis]
MTIDPITLEVLTQALISAVREMRATVCRTASSVAIYDAKDFSCGLFAPDSQVVAQSEDIGSHVVPMPWTVQVAMEKLGHTLKPGDAILVNDPYTGGTHLNDVTVIYPVFAGDRLIFFPAVRAHWADVGGAVPGSMSGKATEIYQEGIRIPPIKILEEGRHNEAAFELLLANMRLPEERLGDLNASFAACRVAEMRIREICDKYGVDQLLEAVRIDLDRAEARMRACISALPDGEYRYEDYLETYMGGRFEPLLLPLTLKIEGDRMIADFTGASPQVPFPVNSTAAVSSASVFIAVKSIFDPAAPLNQGSFRPIEVIAPPGSIVNVQRPAPAGSHGEIRKRVIATMVGALSQVAPDKVAGDLCRTSFHNLLGGYDPVTGREWVHYEWSAGGNGGFAENDGPDVMAPIDWGDLVTVQSSEVIEMRMPLLVESSRVSQDSGGAGTTRGGCSMERVIRVLAPEARYSLLSDGAVLPAFGVLGGMPGCPVGAWTEREGEMLDFDTPGKIAGHPVERDGAVVIRSAGGGGYGDPTERPAERVAEDVREGYVSSAAAYHLYGVVLDQRGEVDGVATAAQRKRLVGSRHSFRAVPVADGFEAGRVSKRRICRLHPSDAAKLDVEEDDIVEFDTRKAAALRGWVRLDSGISPGTVPLDEAGLAILLASAGEPIEIRRLDARSRPAVGLAVAAE